MPEIQLDTLCGKTHLWWKVQEAYCPNYIHYRSQIVT